MPDTISKTITNCRLCGSAELDLILDLGAQPPANSLRTRREEQLPHIPLAICRCRRCTTVQLTESVAPEQLFLDYVWVTGTSSTAREYSRTFYDNICSRHGGNQLFVVEVASNDGTFLQRFREHGHKVLGVDPAQNLVRVAIEAGVRTVPEFFGIDVARRLVSTEGSADVVIARNVLPHVPDPNDVVAGMAHCLKETGVGAIEFHWADTILSELHYDSIYHEHLFYHTLRSIENLLARHQLLPFDVTDSPISGGSLVIYFSKKPRSASASLAEKRACEEKTGLGTLPAWRRFAERSLEHSRQLKALVEADVKLGKKVIGYGASARSSTLLNFCGIDCRHLDCIADQNPLKHDRYTPGTDVLIVSPERALVRNPDTIMLLAWNFKDEIVKSLTASGYKGKVIVPLPQWPQTLQIPG